MPSYSPHVRNIALDLILTIFTCGLWNLYVQHQQCLAVNDMLKVNKYSFWLWLVLCIFTCGFYHFYHEYCMSQDILSVKPIEQRGELAWLSIVLLIFGLTWIVDAIQQSEINAYYGYKHL